MTYGKDVSFSASVRSSFREFLRSFGFDVEIFLLSHDDKSLECTYANDTKETIPLGTGDAIRQRYARDVDKFDAIIWGITPAGAPRLFGSHDCSEVRVGNWLGDFCVKKSDKLNDLGIAKNKLFVCITYGYNPANISKEFEKFKPEDLHKYRIGCGVKIAYRQSNDIGLKLKQAPEWQEQIAELQNFFQAVCDVGLNFKGISSRNFGDASNSCYFAIDG